jgi:hypothetical protein
MLEMIVTSVLSIIFFWGGSTDEVNAQRERLQWQDITQEWKKEKCSHWYDCSTFDSHHGLWNPCHQNWVKCTHELWKCTFYKSKCYKFTHSCVLWRNEFSSLFSVAQWSLLAVSRLSPVTILRAENRGQSSFQIEVKFRVTLWWCVMVSKINSTSVSKGGYATYMLWNIKQKPWAKG